MAQYLAQKELAEVEAREARVKEAYEKELRAVAESQGGKDQRLMNRDFWLSLTAGHGDLSMATDPAAATIAGVGGRSVWPGGEAAAAAITDVQRRMLLERGFAGVPGLDWSAVGVDVDAIAATMRNLKAHGWPPVFVFMYDEPWRMCEALFEVMAPLIADDELVLEASFYGWCLEKPVVADQPELEKVGGNFGVPHRDAGYSESHLPDGTPSILGIWIPVVDTTPENGCMYVVPRERDPMWDAAEDRMHKAPHLMSGFPYAHVRPLPAKAGTVLMWHHSTIHWGSSCSAYADQPRQSIAMSFRLREEFKPWTDHDAELYGRRPYSHGELASGKIDVSERLKLCTRALMMYSVWHPEFHGFDKEHLGVG